MFKAWKNMWKNIMNYTGSVSRKAYWHAIIMNVIFMYIAAIPYALLSMLFTDNVAIVVTVYAIAVHLPVLSLYFRRANDAGWKIGTAVYLAIVTPVLSGLIVGAIGYSGNAGKGSSLIGKIFALSFGLFFYGGLLGLALYNDPTAIPALPVTGLLLASFTLIGYGIKHWKEVVAALSNKSTSE